MSLPKKEPAGKPNSYLKYTAMGFQMVGSMLLGIFIGGWLDRRLGTAQPYLTVLLAFIFTSGAIYLVVKDFLAPK